MDRQRTRLASISGVGSLLQVLGHRPRGWAREDEAPRREALVRGRGPLHMAGADPKWKTLDRKPRHPDVDEYIAQLGEPRTSVVSRIRELIHETLPEAEEAKYWGVPFFCAIGPVMYLSAAKKHLTIGLTRGTAVADDHGLLEGTGVTPIRKAILKWNQPIPEAAIVDWLQQSAAIDATDEVLAAAMEDQRAKEDERARSAGRDEA